MLKNLRISNVALIESLDLELFDGFSVLTGETGAGKSIIIEALNFVLGERASREMIMSGKQKACVEAEFLLTPQDPVLAVLKEHEIELEDESLSLYRELSASGKNVCRVAGAPVSTAILKSIGDALVDIHGQHAHQQLLDPQLHLRLLDDFAGQEILPLRERVAAAYHRMHRAETELKRSTMDARERERRCDLLAYQINEIEKAALIPGEEENLLAERKKLQNAQSIMEGLETGAEGLSGENGALSILSTALQALEGVAQFDGEYEEIVSRFQEAYYSLEDISGEVSRLRSDFSYDPAMLDQMEWRLETISTMKRKYGDSVESVLSYLEGIQEEYAQLSDHEERNERLQKEHEAASKEYLEAASALSELRKATADRLSKRLIPELQDLGMPNAVFSVQFDPLALNDGTVAGLDCVEFLLSTNLGEPVKPLSKVASGGEISRVMLGFKSVLAGSGGVMTMIFDEIDTGISGRIGTAVAEKMRQIGIDHQVVSITHLAQLAACAQYQYLVRKESMEGRTYSTAVLLNEAERVKEIARIMGSSPNDLVALEHAGKLLSDGQNKPN